MLLATSIDQEPQINVDYECHPVARGAVCTAFAEDIRTLFGNVQHNINRAAAALGISGRIAEDGQIGPDTVDLAVRIMSTPKAQEVAPDLANALIGNPVAGYIAELPDYFYSAFDAIAGDLDIPNVAVTSRESDITVPRAVTSAVTAAPSHVLWWIIGIGAAAGAGYLFVKHPRFAKARARARGTVRFKRKAAA